MSLPLPTQKKFRCARSESMKPFKFCAAVLQSPGTRTEEPVQTLAFGGQRLKRTSLLAPMKTYASWPLDRTPPTWPPKVGTKLPPEIDMKLPATAAKTAKRTTIAPPMDQKTK
eukprot:Amastigsp_a343270_51.p2 type:complete len:113 gc:universal Amastigsp_a343270_51:355-17(-)